MARNTANKKDLDTDFAKELEDALDIDLADDGREGESQYDREFGSIDQHGAYPQNQNGADHARARCASQPDFCGNMDTPGAI